MEIDREKSANSKKIQQMRERDGIRSAQVQQNRKNEVLRQVVHHNAAQSKRNAPEKGSMLSRYLNP